MENRKYKVRLNSNEKVEELLQEIYDQSCRMINEVQNEINKLSNSINLGSDEITIDEKAKYSKAIHDLLGDKAKANAQKLEVAKFMGEMLKHAGDMNQVLNDKNYTKKSGLNISDIKAALNGEGGDKDYYNIK